MKQKLKILLVDNGLLLRRGIRRMLEHRGGYEVFEIRNDKSELEALQIKDIGMVLLAVTKGNLSNDKEMVNNIKNKFPPAKVIILCEDLDFSDLYTFYAAGASGMLNKNYEEKIMLENLKLAQKNSHSFDDSLNQALLENRVMVEEQKKLHHVLTGRELEVSKLWCAWKSEEEISKLLDISVNTMRSHKRMIYFKTNTHSRPQLLEFLKKYGL